MGCNLRFACSQCRPDRVYIATSDSSYDQEMVHYLSVRDIAAKSGLAVNTIKGYIRKGLLPPHDATIGTHRGWLEQTIENWMDARNPAKVTTKSMDTLPLDQNVTVT